MSLASPKKGKPTLVVTRTMVWFFILGYSVYLVEQSTYQNYKMNKSIQSAKTRITQLERQKRELQFALDYYKSQSFQEIEARQYLNLQKPDEHVVALPKATTEPTLSIVTSIAPQVRQSAPLPPYIAWWRLFFGDDK
jgi:cell division protein FtsB